MPAAPRREKTRLAVILIIIFNKNRQNNETSCTQSSCCPWRAAEPPSITETSPAVVKVAFGQSVNLTCRAFGAPTPVIEWTRGEAQSRSAELRTTDHTPGGDSRTTEDIQLTVDDAGTLTIQVTQCRALSLPHNSVLMILIWELCLSV